MKSFFDKLLTAIDTKNSVLYGELNPDFEGLPDVTGARLPQRNATGDTWVSQWQEWFQFVIEQTADLVCAYQLNWGFYASWGVPGWELLQQTLSLIPENIPTILDIKHNDLNSSPRLATQIFETLAIDAVTLSAYFGQDLAAPFLVYPDKAVFILCVTANPSATLLQEYPAPDRPLYLKLVEDVQTWGTPEQVGLQVGVMPDMLARIRQVAPERLILIQGDLAEENDLTNFEDLKQVLAAGLDINGGGLLLPAPPSLFPDANILNELRDRINEERLQVMAGHPTCELWLPDVCFLQHQAHRDLILQIYDIGCLVFGDHVQSSGAVFPYYIDLRRIISLPQIFHRVVTAYSEILATLTFDRIAGIPYGSLPTATGLALRMDRPMIFPRKEVKAYGAGRLIEGHFIPGETIVVVDDILITGNSAIEGAGKLKSVGLNVEDIVVFIDHEQGVKERLQTQGYRGHAVLTLSEIAQTLYQANRITSEQFELLTEKRE